MSDFGGGFDASQVEPSGAYEALPAGEYKACIVASEKKKTKDGSGELMNVTLQILDGPFKNRTLFDRLNLWNKSPKAVEIAKGTLSAICRAVNVLKLNDSSEFSKLHMKPLLIKVSQREYNDVMQNEIKSYKACVAPAQPAAAATTSETKTPPKGW